MDKEKLIRVVKSKRPLWDRSNKFFRNRDHTKELWKEVAEEMDESCDVVKKKWTGLRDVFRREWKHIYAASKASTGVTNGVEPNSIPKKSTWPYLENMLFLAPQMVFHDPQEYQTDIKEEMDDSSLPDSYPDELPFEAQFEEGSYDSPAKVDEQKQAALSNITNATNSPADIHKLLEDANRDAMAKITFKRPLSFVESSTYTSEPDDCKRPRFHESGDSDQQFLMSLLPFLRAVPGNRKMSVRMRLQQVFLEEEERMYQHAAASQVTVADLRKAHASSTPVASSTWVSSNSVSSPTIDLG